MGRGARSVTRPIPNWLTVCDFTIRLRLVWTFRASYDARQPQSSRDPKLRRKIVKAQRRFEMQVGIGWTLSKRRRDTPNVGASERDYDFFQQKLRERKPSGAIDPFFSSFSTYRLLRSEFVTYYEFHARHFDVVSSRNIVTPTRLRSAGFAIASNNGWVTVCIHHFGFSLNSRNKLAIWSFWITCFGSSTRYVFNKDCKISLWN